MMNQENTILVVVDIQTRLTRVMHEKETLIQRVVQLISGLRVLNVPVLWLEQYPEGLGPTQDEIAEALQEYTPIIKTTFSGWGAPEFKTQIETLNPQHILVCGIESHVCVYQTVSDLIEAGFHTEVVTDAVSSRTQFNRDLGLRKMEQLGAGITSVEMALFELLKIADGKPFRQILKIIK